MKNLLRLTVIVAALAGLAAGAPAQQQKVPKIGVLVSSSPSANAARDEALRQGLRELGYTEGRNVMLEYRYADGKLDRLTGLAAELVRLNADVIVAGGTRVAVAARQATGTIPIVVAGAGDLVRAGLVKSFMRPGGNVTGVSRLSPDFIGKRLEVLKEAVPKTARVAVLLNADNPGQGPTVKEIELGARAWAMMPQSVAVRSPNDFESAFGAAARGGADALFLLPDALFNSHLSRIAELAAKNRLPAVYDRREFVEAGGFMSFGVNLADLSRRAAWYVDQILKGSKPGDLSMVEPTKYELLLNLKTAKELGLVVPPNVLARADKVIK